MKAALTFIIPVRHQENATNWETLKSHLSETAQSIAAQDSNNWRAIVVANYGADLPTLPDGFEVKRVDFPPNRLHRQGAAAQEDFHRAVRSDKGRRILAGMLHAGEMAHVMLCDDDDLVSRRLASFVAANPEANGWFIREGYIWSDGGKLLFRYRDFSRLCGSSHIVRADLYKLPDSLESADETFIQEMLGSHTLVHDRLDEAGTPLAPLPFLGAVYRTGHSESHSRSHGIISEYFFRKYLLKRPWEVVWRLSRIKPITQPIAHEFFGH